MFRNIAVAAAATGGAVAVYYGKPHFVRLVASTVDPTPDWHAMKHAPHPALQKRAAPPAPISEDEQDVAHGMPYLH
jgi:hypothetical protein